MLHIYKQAYNIQNQTVPYRPIHLLTAHSLHSMSHLPVDLSTRYPIHPSSAHFLTLPVPSTLQPVNQSFYLPSICPTLQRIFNLSISLLIHPHLPSLLIHPSSTQHQHHLFCLQIDLSTRKPIHPYSCQIFHFTFTVPFNCNMHSSSAHSPHNLTHRSDDPSTSQPVLQSVHFLICALSISAFHIFDLSTSPPIHPSSAHPSHNLSFPHLCICHP